MGYAIAWKDDKSDFFEKELSRVCNEVRAHTFLKDLSGRKYLD
jgi:hypothetical protein